MVRRVVIKKKHPIAYVLDIKKIIAGYLQYEELLRIVGILGVPEAIRPMLRHQQPYQLCWTLNSNIRCWYIDVDTVKHAAADYYFEILDAYIRNKEWTKFKVQCPLCFRYNSIRFLNHDGSWKVSVHNLFIDDKDGIRTLYKLHCDCLFETNHQSRRNDELCFIANANVFFKATRTSLG